jgi:SAM-dependent methyltransferase
MSDHASSPTRPDLAPPFAGAAQAQARSEAAERWEQHWVAPAALGRVFEAIDVRGRALLELGAGTGNLTRALLAAGAASVEAWEIDPALPAVDDARVAWRLRDIALLSADDLRGRALASFPPYLLLPAIKAALDAAGATDAMLMVPGRLLPSFEAEGWRLAAELGGADFEPPSRGKHFVVARGFAP